MPLPVIANVYRCTLNYVADNNVTPRNVLHLRSTTQDEAGIGASIDDNLTTNMLAFLNNSQTVDSVDIIALDGSSGTVNVNITNTADGQGTGGTLPASAAVLSIHTLQRGPQGRGRIYIGPMCESNMSNGFLLEADRVNCLAAWEAFFTALLADDIEPGVASYVHSTFYGYQSLSMRGQAGTMRRRQNQLL